MTDINTIKNYWNKQPCNINHSKAEFLSKQYFDEVENKKYFVEYHISEFAEFEKWNNKNVLEIGCGIGTDAINFARNKANYTGIELSDESLNITKKRFELFNLKGTFCSISCEEDLSVFGFNKFDLIYSFGVIHHTPNINKVLENCKKLLKEDGILKIMVYAKNSWKNVMIQNGLDQYEAQNGCPLANTYTKDEITKILENNGFKVNKIYKRHIFPYKIGPYKNNIYEKHEHFHNMSDELFEILENAYGWHLCVECYKSI
jgi:2-polyprenyl-3-methyl-5-hydroxy-6-metoxy-1,4-benzoquinol methylase